MVASPSVANPGSTATAARRLLMKSPAPTSRTSEAVTWLTTKLPKWLPLPGEARFQQALARIDEIVFDMVAARRSSGALGDDLLGTLLRMNEAGELVGSVGRRLQEKAVVHR